MSKLEDLIAKLCPNGVEYKKIGDVAIKISDGMHNLPKGISSEGEYPVLSAQNINNGFISVKSSKWVSKEIFDVENKRTNVSKNDVLLTIVGAIGRVAVIESDIKALFQRSVCVIKPNIDIVFPKFLYHSLLSSNIQNYMSTNAHGAAQKGLYLKQVYDVTIPIPPLDVQAEIVQILDTFTELTTKLTENLTAELTARKKQYEYYRNALLTFDDNNPLHSLISHYCPNGVEYKALSEVSDMKRGTTVTKKSVNPGDIPVISGGREPAYYCDTSNRNGETITVSGSGAGAGFVQYWDKPIFVCDAFSVKGCLLYTSPSPRDS